MPNTTQLLQMLDQWVIWLMMCTGMPMSTQACRPLWQWVMYAAAAIGVWLLLWVAWKAVQQRQQYDAAIRAQMERERVAEPAVMEQHRFKEAGDLVADVTDPHLAKTIRDELDRRKLENITTRK